MSQAPPFYISFSFFLPPFWLTSLLNCDGVNFLVEICIHLYYNMFRKVG
nr:MAG TPA: hypothetical protein [Caudoviricetes sp.]